jgi:intein/homing endonuclease
MSETYNPWKQYREIKRGEFIIVAADTSAGGSDYNACQFLSKTNIDVPLVYHSKGIATNMTNAIFPVIEKIYDVTGIKPTVVYEVNNGGVFELQRLATLNRLNKYSIFLQKGFGRVVNDMTTRIGWSTNTAPLSLDTGVLTVKGWKKLKDIKVGDKVFGSDGKPVKVTGYYPKGKLKAFTLKTSDGSSTICDENHLWGVISKWYKNGKTRVLPTNYIRKSLKRGWFIPLVKPIQFKKKKLLIDPYLLGLLLGDGSFGKTITYSTIDEELIESVKLLIPKQMHVSKASHDSYTISGTRKDSPHGQNILQKQLIKLELRDTRSHNKFIPSVYLTSDINDRLSILQGLMDTDGCVTTRNSAFFSTTSYKLAQDVRNLVLSLGGYSSITKEDKKHIGWKDCYRVLVVLAQNPFRLKRKADRYNYILRKKWKRRRIVSIEPLNKKVEMACIRIDNPNGLFVIDDFLLTHNTRPKMLSDLKDAIDNEVLKVYDKETIEEMFSFIVNRQGKPVAENGQHDDLCFVAGTKIMTSKGQIPVEKLKLKDMVMTTEGLKPILAMSKRKAKVIKRLGLVGTPDHPIITKRGVVPLDKVKASDIIYIWNEKLSSIEEKNITDILNLREDNYESIIGDTVIGKNHPLHYIGRFGLTILEKSQKIMLSIIKIIILLTIALIILSLYNLINICLFICKWKIEKNYYEKTEKNKQNELKKPLKNGKKTIKNWLIKFIKRMGKKTKKELLRHLKDGERKIQNWQKKYQLRQENLKQKKSNELFLNGERNTQNGEKKLKKILNIYFLKNPKQLFVYNVVKLLLILENKVLNFAVKVAELDTKDRKENEQIVYNLLVDNPHNYFANNILVHNCMSLAIAWQLYQTENKTARKPTGGIPYEQAWSRSSFDAYR